MNIMHSLYHRKFNFSILFAFLYKKYICSTNYKFTKKKKKKYKKLLTKAQLCDRIYKSRGISAVGSAQHWQCWGQGFESPMLHQ